MKVRVPRLGLRGFLAVLALLVLAAAFSGYLSAVRALGAPPQAAPSAHAIVALTGGTSGRVRQALDLLEGGAGRRLLISGVNPNVTDAELIAAFEISPRQADCCIDFGRNARDTLGNAAETAAWARRHNYTRLLIVTDDYHMPRSLIELGLAMPEASLIAYPVETGMARPGRWAGDPGAAARVAVEFGKYAVVRVRELIVAAAGGPNPSVSPAP